MSDGGYEEVCADVKLICILVKGVTSEFSSEWYIATHYKQFTVIRNVVI